MENNSQLAAQYGGNITTNDDNTITRSNLRNCAVTSSYVKRSTFNDCVLLQVRSASRSTGKRSHFHGATSVKRSEVTESTLLEKSSAHRSTIKTSTVRDASTIKTSVVTGSTISHSQLRRTNVKDCDVEDCIISRSSFEGMVLEYGVWKKGQLIGKIGDKEPVAIQKDDPRLTVGTPLHISFFYVALTVAVHSRAVLPGHLQTSLLYQNSILSQRACYQSTTWIVLIQPRALKVKFPIARKISLLHIRFEIRLRRKLVARGQSGAFFTP